MDLAGEQTTPSLFWPYHLEEVTEHLCVSLLMCKMGIRVASLQGYFKGYYGKSAAPN